MERHPLAAAGVCENHVVGMGMPTYRIARGEKWTHFVKIRVSKESQGIPATAFGFIVRRIQPTRRKPPWIPVRGNPLQIDERRRAAHLIHPLLPSKESKNAPTFFDQS
jgi:hypothetical protein